MIKLVDKKTIVLGKDTPKNLIGKVAKPTPFKTVAKTKVLFTADLCKLKPSVVENALDTLLNTGYRPILTNNEMVVFVKAVKVPIKPKTNK